MSFLQMYNYPLLEFGFRHILRDPLNRLHDQHFGETLTAKDMIKPIVVVDTGEYRRQWRPQNLRDIGSTFISDRNKFEVKLDVQRFGRDEVQVKIIDGFIVVEAKHEEKQDDHGYVSRQFVRRYAMPADIAADDIESRLSTDGILTITAQRKGAVTNKIVPVQHTGPEQKDSKNQGSSKDQGSSSQEKKEDPKESKKESKKDSQLRKMLK